MSYVLVTPNNFLLLKFDVFKIPFLGMVKLCAPIVSRFELTKYMYFTELIIVGLVLKV